ncbi:rhodanese-like domain-containing protein [Pseudooceanicola nanhaiensis]|uniref:rhodanese-like domain-containing protein n=1 Tax=Pseudooceanicola nanhaiensis TaxID=375761 RepID=UPI001CD600E0|nr:rhodanese-like domain-containing protein [Pseudooceanicola nanhaiensis]MCA0920056.1 rhodanese-like domain-containing protein [Pseudooceanicola nanhaiensis]
MPLGYKQMLEEADAAVTSFSPIDALALKEDPAVVFVDIRDPRELEREGMIPGAKHAPRGMLEFWIDPESPYHKEWFAEDRTFLFYCASGWRSLLAAKLAQDMGLRAASLRGGFGDWKRAGQPTAERKAKQDT